MSTLPFETRLTTPYGFFSPDGKEYCITDLHTPRPWINVMSNSRYGLVLSHLGGGFSWIENSQLQRLTRWDQDLSVDRFGRWIYLVDTDDREQLWSTTYMPTEIPAEEEFVRHGGGYTVFERRLFGIETKHTTFVATDVDAEFAMVEVTNHRDRPASLELASFVDWFLGPQSDWHREFHRLFIETKIEGPIMTAWKHTGLTENSRLQEKLPFVAYHSVSGGDEVTWFGDKAAFLGTPGSMIRPEGLLQRVAHDSTGRWDDPIGCAVVGLKLAPGETRTVVFVLGTEDDARSCLARAKSIGEAEARTALEKVRRHWSELHEATTVDTPDPVFNLLNNVWFKNQTVIGRMEARCAYYQQGGAYGYRDQLQDSLIALTYDPKRTLKQIGLHAEAMYEDGGVRHWWHPGTPIIAESHHSDTCLWLSHATLAYLDETNDLNALESRHRFLNRTTQQFGETGTLLDHMLRGIDRSLNRLSPRGLPLIGAGDWNDGLSHAGIEGKGESVWLAMFLFDILERLHPLLSQIGDSGRAAQLHAAAMGLQMAVETHGWDGHWYIAGTRDDGRPFGSHENSEGSIFLNPQTWAVISGIASPDRAKQALASAREHLSKPYGMLLLTPAYSAVDPYIGYITRYAPGLRENGGVYSHASTWAVMAMAKEGQVDEAYEIYQAMYPAKHARDATRYSAEPYVMPGNVDGPDSPYEGRGGWTWYTGSSAWMHRMGLDWLCGVRATREGLVFGEGPSQWDNVKVRRQFRGCVADIEMTGKGPVTAVSVNGEVVQGPVNPNQFGGGTVQIHVSRG